MRLFWRYRVGLSSVPLGFSATVTAAAQDIGTPAFDSVMPGQGMTMNATIRAQGEYLAAGKHRTATRSASTSAASATSLTYHGTPALRQQAVQAYANRLKISNPAGLQASTATCVPGQYAYNQTYRQILNGTGLRENDAADALACYRPMGWSVVHNAPDGKAISQAFAKQ